MHTLVSGTIFYNKIANKNYECNFKRNTSCAQDDSWIRATGWTLQFANDSDFNPIITDKRWEGEYTNSN